MAEAASTFERVLTHINLHLETLSKGQKDIATGQAKVEGELAGLKEHVYSQLNQHEERLGAIDNVRDGAIKGIRDTVSSQGKKVNGNCRSLRLNKWIQGFILIFLLGLLSTMCMSIYTYNTQPHNTPRTHQIAP